MADTELTKEEIVAMAIASIAEELQTDIKRVKVISFHEITEEVTEEE